MTAQAQAHRVRFSYEDYVLFPEDGKRHEIIDGDHYATPSPKTKHQIVSGNLLILLGSFVRGKNLGKVIAAPFDVVLSNEDVVQPDLLFVSWERLPIVTENNVQGPPDLAIEILSETTRRMDEMVKRKLYKRFGVREYWIVDPELASVKVYRMTEKGYARIAELSVESDGILTTPLLPGFEAPLSAVFED